MSPADARKRFIKAFNQVATHHRRLRVFEDFLELGATYKGQVIQNLPAHFHKLKAALNGEPPLPI